MVFSYRAFFGGAREGGCLFCPERRAELKVSVYEDETILTIKNRKLAGADHWLIIPKAHIRDIESLTKADLALIQAMGRVKDVLLKEYYPGISALDIHVGYHRGHRPLGGWFGTFGLPDIISIHHLHLHVIVQPNWYWTWFKYPNWCSPMWVSHDWVTAKLKEDYPVITNKPRAPSSTSSTAGCSLAEGDLALQKQEFLPSPCGP